VETESLVWGLEADSEDGENASTPAAMEESKSDVLARDDIFIVLDRG